MRADLGQALTKAEDWQGAAQAFREALKKAYPAARVDEFAASQLDLLAADMRRRPSGTSPDAGVPAESEEQLKKELEAALKADQKPPPGAPAPVAVTSSDAAPVVQLWDLPSFPGQRQP